MAEITRNPNLMNPAMMKQSQNTAGIGENVQLMSEILKKINNAKDKPKKIAILKENASAPLKQVLKGAFDPSIEWELPAGDPPYMANEAPVGTEHGLLRNEAKVLLGMKNKSLNKMYKGLTESVVKEAFGWNDKFVRPEPEQK